MQEIIQSCVEQEEKYQLTAFSRADALRLGNLLCEVAERYTQGVAVAIEVNGLRVFQHVAEGAGEHNVEWMQRKFNMVNRFGKSSLRVWAEFTQDQISMEEQCLPKMEFGLCGGGFPLIVRGVGPVGVIGVSGLPHLDDHQVIVDALERLIAEK